jgi:hypothetical protein
MVVVLLSGCAAAPTVIIRGSHDPALRRDVAEGSRKVEAFFGAPYRRPPQVDIYPDRASFDVHFQEVFADATFKSECWMIGVANGKGLALLDPARWKDEACDHEHATAETVARVVTHELVHVYHSQMNPLLDTEPDRFEPLGWFVEGLATYASGQRGEPERAPAREAVAGGHAPAALAEAWKGKYRYGVSGSLVGFVDAQRGRAAVVKMLQAASQAELLGAAGFSERELLDAWAASLRER